MSITDLLGGASRENVLVYGHANDGAPAETVAKYIDRGYTAIRMQPGISGIA